MKLQYQNLKHKTICKAYIKIEVIRIDEDGVVGNSLPSHEILTSVGKLHHLSFGYASPKICTTSSGDGSRRFLVC